MVDLETSGTMPDRHGIIQLSAWKFNYDTGEISDDVFDRCLLIPKHRSWSEETRKWWMQQKAETLKAILNRAENPEVVMQAYADWVGYQHATPIRFWSKPSHFDYMFTASYLTDFGIHNPCHYRWARDLNSFMAGLLKNPEHPEIEVEFQGDVHNAMFDALHQIALLLKAKEIAKELARVA